MSEIQIDKLNTILIVSKGRPNNPTCNYLKQIGYPYWFLILEDDEEFREEYAYNYGEDRILEFNLASYQDFDTHDIYGTQLSTGTSPCRNASIDWALQLGLDRFWMADDTINYFAIFTDVETKKKILRGDELYDYLFCVSKFAKSIDAENVSLGPDRFIDRSASFFNRVGFGAGNLMNLSPKTTFRFESRGYPDCNRFYEVHRHCRINITIRNFVIALKSQSTNSKKGGGLAKLRKIFTKDIMAASLVMPNPLMTMNPKPKKYVTPGYYISPKFKVDKLRSEILSSEYADRNN